MVSLTYIIFVFIFFSFLSIKILCLKTRLAFLLIYILSVVSIIKGRWPRGRLDVLEPGVAGVRFLVSAAAGRRSSALSTLKLLRSTPSLVQCCVWLVTVAWHVHRGMGRLEPVTDFWGQQMGSILSFAAGQKPLSE